MKTNMKNIDLTKKENLFKLKKELNNVIENRINEAIITELIKSVDDMPFATCKSLFESVTDRLYDTANGKKLIAKYVKMLKEDKAASTMYLLCDLFHKPEYTTNPTMLVNEAMAICRSKNFKQSDMAKSKAKFGDIVKSAIKESKMTAVEINNVVDKNKVLNESIDYIFENGDNLKDINQTVTAKEILINYLNENTEDKSSTIKSEKSVKELYSELQESLNIQMEPWEKSVLNSVSVNCLVGGYENMLFEEYKNKCIESINALVENENGVEEKSRLTTMRAQLEAKQYSKDTIIEDLLNLSKLNYTLSE